MLLSLCSVLLLALILSFIGTLLVRHGHVLAQTAERRKAPAGAAKAGETSATTAKRAPAVVVKPVLKKDEEKKKAQSDKDKDEPGQPFEPGNPLLILEGVRCQVHREGNIRQDITAQSGRYDEEENILDMDRLHVEFKDQGKSLGALSCGGGRVWTSDRPKEHINAHDMLLQRTVRLQTPEQIMLETPEMRYNALESRLWSDKGFVKQLPVRRGFMVGQGDRFDIKLLLDQNKFDYWKEYGNPVVIKKSEKPVLEP